MKDSKLLTAALNLGLALAAGQAYSAADYLLELDGTSGESATKDPPQSIEASFF